MVGKLTVEMGPSRGTEFIIREGETFVMGRDRKNQFMIASSEASRYHAKIEAQRGIFTITDMGSKNGTRVNDVPITSRPLRDGDVIELAKCRIRFTLLEEAPEGPMKRTTPFFALSSAARTAEKAEKLEKPVVPSPAPAVMPKPTPVQEAPHVSAPRFAPEELALVGSTLGNCKVLAPLARGRRTIIYKGADPAKNRIVAIKVLRHSLAKLPEFIRWFVDGARTAGRMKHEDVVRALGGGKQGEIYYFITEFMEGGDAVLMFQNAQKEGVSLVKKALQSVIRVARALEYGYSEGVLHRGVRPSKVLFDQDGQANLNSLGFDNGPCIIPEAESSSADPFFAPEQRRAESTATIQTDVYCLGATFYYMLTGRPPSRGLKQVVDSPRSYNPAVPDSLCRIVERMLDFKPEDRYNTYGQLLHDLRWALRGEAWPKS